MTQPLKQAVDRGSLFVVLAASACSVAACVYFYRSGITFGYHDTYAHLEISRRFLVGPTPSIAQLGGIWLPLPHVFQSLLAWNTTLYETGLAGSIVSMVAFVICTTLIYKTIRVFSGERVWPAVAGAAVFATNPNMLYHQTTAMDELVFYACTLGVIYFLVRWGDTGRPVFVLEASICSLLAMLCRYEAWFLSAVYVVTIALMSWRMGHRWRDLRALSLIAIVFGSATAAGGWLLYNYLIFDSPLNFLSGADSSADQMARRTTDFQAGDWALTLKSYWTGIQSNVGLLFIGLAVLGLIVLLFRDRLSARSLPIFAIISIIPFWIYSIFGGKAPIGVPSINGYLLNFRFALVVLLPVALLIGYLAATLPRLGSTAAGGLIVAGALAVSGYTFQADQIALAAERDGIQISTEFQRQVAVAEFLKTKTEGQVLANLVGSERALFPVIDRLIYEGSRTSQDDLWASALRDPAASGIKVIVMRTADAGERGGVARADDAVHIALGKSPELKKYRRAFSNETFAVYILK